MDDKDRTIRIQQNKLEQYEKEKQQDTNLMAQQQQQEAKNIEMANSATQTERVSCGMLQGGTKIFIAPLHSHFSSGQFQWGKII